MKSLLRGYKYSKNIIFKYNWTIARQEENCKNGGEFISNNFLRKEITKLKKTKLQWLA